MSFLHHGLPLILADERKILPTAQEAADGIESISVILGWCQHPDCGERLVFIRLNSDNTPHHGFKRLKSGIAPILKRLKLAVESDWVWGTSKDGHSRKVKVPVR